MKTSSDTIFLDSIGIEDALDIMFDKVYKGRLAREYYGPTPAPEQERAALTREDLNKYDFFQLFKALAEQSGFPVPGETGRAHLKHFRPSALPTDLVDLKGFPEQEYKYALDKLFNSENRAGGVVRRSGYGSHKRTGRQTVSFIPTPLFSNIIDWMASHIPAGNQMVMPPEREKATFRGSIEEHYKKISSELKTAFCKGMGVDPESVEEDFLTFFKRLLVEARCAPHEAGLNGNLAPRNLALGTGTGVSLSGAVVRIFNPQRIEDLAKQNDRDSFDITRTQSKHLTAKLVALFKKGNIENPLLLSSEEAFKFGYTLRHLDLLFDKSLVFGPLAEIPPEYLNTLQVKATSKIFRHRTENGGEIAIKS